MVVVLFLSQYLKQRYLSDHLLIFYKIKMDRSYSKFVAVVDLVLEVAVDDDVVVVVVVDSEIDDAFKTKKK